MHEPIPAFRDRYRSGGRGTCARFFAGAGHAVRPGDEAGEPPMNRLFAQGHGSHAHSPDRKPDRSRRLGV